MSKTVMLILPNDNGAKSIKKAMAKQMVLEGTAEKVKGIHNVYRELSKEEIKNKVLKEEEMHTFETQENEKRFFEAWCDGGTNSNTRLSRIGGYIKHPDGQVLDEFSLKVPYSENVPLIEYKALNELLSVILKYGIKNVVIHMDNKGVVEAMNERKQTRFINFETAPKKLIEQHKLACERMSKIRFTMIKWIPRERNQKADSLTKPKKVT